MAEPQDELVCGSGASAFVIHDNAHLVRARHALVRRGRESRQARHQGGAGSPRSGSNPESGKIVPYTQTDKITDVLAVPGDFESATGDARGVEHLHRPGDAPEGVAEHWAKRVRSGRGAGEEFRAGHHPFIDAFVDGDMSVFDGRLRGAGVEGTNVVGR